MAFHYDQPDARAPQAILLAVCPDSRPTWDDDLLTAILTETLGLARIRTVDLDSVQQIGQLLPGLYFALNLKSATISPTSSRTSRRPPLPSLQSVAACLVARPSITTWTRLEPLPREGSRQRSLQAQIRDGLWMIMRQWLLGGFLGDDAGSPVDATLGVELRGITTYRPGSGNSVPIDLKLPIEVQVEREPVALRMRGSVQLGLYFENLVRKAGIANAATVIAAFRTAFPIASAPPDPDLARLTPYVSGLSLRGA
jgi:hypothetical protein